MSEAKVWRGPGKCARCRGDIAEGRQHRDPGEMVGSRSPDGSVLSVIDVWMGCDDEPAPSERPAGTISGEYVDQVTGARWEWNGSTWTNPDGKAGAHDFNPNVDYRAPTWKHTVHECPPLEPALTRRDPPAPWDEQLRTVPVDLALDAPALLEALVQAHETLSAGRDAWLPHPDAPPSETPWFVSMGDDPVVTFTKTRIVSWGSGGWWKWDGEKWERLA